MSLDMPAACEGEAIAAGAQARSAPSPWLETALTLLFAAAAVLFASFVAVASGMV